MSSCNHSKTLLFQLLLNSLAVWFYLQDDPYLLHQLILKDLRNKKFSTLDYIQILDIPPKDLTGWRANLSVICLNENQRPMTLNIRAFDTKSSLERNEWLSTTLFTETSKCSLNRFFVVPTVAYNYYLVTLQYKINLFLK